MHDNYDKACSTHKPPTTLADCPARSFVFWFKQLLELDAGPPPHGISHLCAGETRVLGIGVGNITVVLGTSSTKKTLVEDVPYIAIFNKAVCVRFNKFGSSAGNREFDGKKLCETFLIKEKITQRNICSNKFSSGNSLRNEWKLKNFFLMALLDWFHPCVSMCWRKIEIHYGLGGVDFSL